MQPRNPYVRALFDALKDENLSSDDRNSRVATSIATIVATKPSHDEFKRLNASNIDPYEEVDLNLVDENDRMPLCYAVHYNHTESVRLLLDANANPNTPNKKTGIAPLIIAAQDGYTESVRLLLEAGANPNTPSKKTNGTPLIIAAQHGYTESVRLLLEAGANPNTPGGKTNVMPLRIAVYQGHTESVQLLLEAKADVDHLNLNYRNRTALDCAIDQEEFSKQEDPSKQKRRSIVLLLLRYNASVNFKNINKYLSSQDQRDPYVVECLEILSNNSKKAVAVVPVPMQKKKKENEEFYLIKLITLHKVCKALFCYLINESSRGDPIPDVIALLIFDYNGFVKSDARVRPIKFFKPATVDPHLENLKKEILKTTGAKTRFFDGIIKEIHDAKKIHDAAPNVDHKCVVM